MTADQGARILYLGLLMVLVGSAIVSRRLPLARSLKLALAWAAIFAVVIFVFTWLGGS